MRGAEVIRIAPRFAPDAALREKWPRVRTMIVVTRPRVDRGSVARALGKATATGESSSPQPRTTISYYLSSMEHSAASAHRVVRRHWHVENSLHWMLDVAYGGDDSQVRDRTAARNLAIARRMAKNMLTVAGNAKGGVRDQRRIAASEDSRDQVFSQ